MQRFLLLLIFCAFFFVGCFRGEYYWRNALFEVQVNSHYWQGVCENDTLVITELVSNGGTQYSSGSIVVKNISFDFKDQGGSFSKGIFCDSFKHGPIGHISFSTNLDTLFLWLDPEFKDSLNINVAQERINLLKTPYNPNFKNSRYEEKILKKIKARL
jgi:hypothetical protein